MYHLLLPPLIFCLPVPAAKVLAKSDLDERIECLSQLRTLCFFQLDDEIYAPRSQVIYSEIYLFRVPFELRQVCNRYILSYTMIPTSSPQGATWVD